MAPEIDKVLNQADQNRREFLRKIIAGAAFAPPLLASFNLDGLSVASATPMPPNMCVVSNATIPPRCFTFAGTQYQMNFTQVLGTGGIAPGLDLGGTGHTAVNFTGSAGPGGRVWATVLNSSPTGPSPAFEITLTADVLIHRYNNSKGVGLMALAFRLAGNKALALIVNDAGNTDALQLFTVDTAGATTLLQSVPLGAGIAENVWYRLEMVVERGTCELTPGGSICPVHVTGEVFRHLVPSDPDSELGSQVGGTLHFEDELTFMPGSPTGQVGMIGRAVSTAVDSSITNFCVICIGELPGSVIIEK